MKRILKITPIFLLTLTLNSCYIGSNNRTNYIIPGSFRGVDIHSNVTYYLDISIIRLNDYNNANGVNVIKDEVRDAYYSLDFYRFKDGIKIKHNFLNFKDVTKAYHYCVRYNDDNDYTLMPIHDTYGIEYQLTKADDSFLTTILTLIS